MLSLLRADTVHCASVSSREQAALMAGVSTAELAGDVAMWADSPADLARRKREKERLQQAAGTTTVDALKLLEARTFGLEPFRAREEEWDK